MAASILLVLFDIATAIDQDRSQEKAASRMMLAAALFMISLMAKFARMFLFLI